MKCEYCDSIIREVPDNGVCPNCGMRILDGSIENQKLSIFGKTEGLQGGLELWPYTVCIRKTLSQEGEQRVIALRDIYQVCYRPAEKGYDGFLAIRDRKKDGEMPTTVEEAELDEGAVLFAPEMNDRFKCIYMYLQHCCTEKQTDTSIKKHAKEKCCPKCKSSNYRVQQNAFNLPHRQEKSLLLILVRMLLYVYYTFRKIPRTYICNNCGEKWTAW